MKTKQKTVEPIKDKTINISAKIALQNGGILFELNESHSFKEGELGLEEINNLKIQLLANNLISLNNFQKQIEEKI
jgi:hypothetical protein